MLYLPRLLVYHCEAEAGSKQSETFKVMERRLLRRRSSTPAMIVTWLAGLYLAWAGHWYVAGWFHVKFLLVLLLLSGVPGFFARSGARFLPMTAIGAARNSIGLSTKCRLF